MQTVGVLGAGHGAGGGRRVHGGGGGRGLEHSRQREAGHGTESHTQRLGRGLQSVVLTITDYLEYNSLVRYNGQLNIICMY